MSAAASAELMVLRGLLLTVVEVQNIVRDTNFAEVDGHQATLAAACRQVEQLVESAPVAELVQLARAALETKASTPAPANQQVFYGIVTQYDCNERYREQHRARQAKHGSPPDGPIIFEQYLLEEARDRAKLEEKAASMTDYGWVRVAEIRVEIPETPAAIPAAAAGVHA